MTTAAQVIAALGLQPHPEGGWYRETWRADAPEGQRAGGTCIHFLLEPGQSSHWHRVDAAELWLFQAGAALSVSTPEGDVRLGPDVLAGDQPQLVIQPGQWQAAKASDEGWSLVACVVVPGFEFSGFELAPPGWSPI